MTAVADTTQNASGAPLAGRSVVVTRTAEQSRALAGPLEALGAQVIAFPVIATVEPEDWLPVDAAIERLDSYDWLVLTSANAVRCFFDRIVAKSNDFLAPFHGGEDSDGGGDGSGTRPRIAVVGTATQRALEARGLEADLVPADFRAEGLVDEFVRLGVGEGTRVLLPRALEAREILPDTLRERGATVDVVPVYRTVRAEPDPSAVAQIAGGTIDAVTFTSPSTFRNFREVLAAAGYDADETLRSLAIASIGPVTSEAVRAAGHHVALEPAEYTVEGLVGALVEYFSVRR